MAGRPKGSRNRQSCKPFRDALRMEVFGAGDDRKALREIAQGLIRKARNGEVAAIREVADRLDGRPAQAVEMSGGLTITHEEALEQLE
jgi:hypothetical protein